MKTTKYRLKIPEMVEKRYLTEAYQLHSCDEKQIEVPMVRGEKALVVRSVDSSRFEIPPDWLEPIEDCPVSAEEVWEAHLKCIEDGVLSRELERSDFFEIWKICEANTHLLYAELMKECEEWFTGMSSNSSLSVANAFDKIKEHNET
jgi:hypothetical protein